MKSIKKFFSKIVTFVLDLFTPKALKEMKAETARMEEQAQADIADAKAHAAEVEAKVAATVEALNKKDLAEREEHFIVMKILTLVDVYGFSYKEAEAAREAGDRATLERILKEMEARTYVEQPYVNVVANELVDEPVQQNRNKVVKMRKPKSKARHQHRRA